MVKQIYLDLLVEYLHFFTPKKVATGFNKDPVATYMKFFTLLQKGFYQYIA